MKFINLTPLTIALNSGKTFAPISTDTKECARVSASFTQIDGYFCRQQFGEIEGLPAPSEGVFYIVSALVFAATDRQDVIAPATGHPDCQRNEKGHILSVPCFLKK